MKHFNPHVEVKTVLLLVLLVVLAVLCARAYYHDPVEQFKPDAAAFLDNWVWQNFKQDAVPYVEPGLGDTEHLRRRRECSSWLNQWDNPRATKVLGCVWQWGA